MSALNGAALLITGGAGSFGHTAFKYFPENGVQQIRFFPGMRNNRMICAMPCRRGVPMICGGS